jgi:translation initiation factor 2-alpha kinase 4
MCYEFSTGMQLAIVLSDLRNGMFPDDFPANYLNQEKIIKMFYLTSSKMIVQRVSSDGLPPKVEDDYISRNECVPLPTLLRRAYVGHVFTIG